MINARHKGYILLTTLLLLVIISLLVLTIMHQVLLYYKAVNATAIGHQHFYQLEQVALALAKDSRQWDPKCVVHGDKVNKIKQRLLRLNGCPMIVDTLKYQYLIEKLGNFSCLTAQVNGKTYATYHLRVSVLQIKEGQQNALLQIRYLSPVTQSACYNEIHPVQLGVSSWRYM